MSHVVPQNDGTEAPPFGLTQKQWDLIEQQVDAAAYALQADPRTMSAEKFGEILDYLVNGPKEPTTDSEIRREIEIIQERHRREYLEKKMEHEAKEAREQAPHEYPGQAGPTVEAARQQQHSSEHVREIQSRESRPSSRGGDGPTVERARELEGGWVDKMNRGLGQ